MPQKQVLDPYVLGKIKTGFGTGDGTSSASLCPKLPKPRTADGGIHHGGIAKSPVSCNNGNDYLSFAGHEESPGKTVGN